jgi:hypothetical protein
MEKSRGLKVIYQPDSASEAIVDIVFVHGLGGDSYGTWLERTTSSYWPSDFLSQDIPESRILTFGYAASWTSFDRGDLCGYASDLLLDLCDLRLQESVSTAIPFVCYSLFSDFAGDVPLSPYHKFVFIGFPTGDVVIAILLMMATVSKACALDREGTVVL